MSQQRKPRGCHVQAQHAWYEGPKKNDRAYPETSFGQENTCVQRGTKSNRKVQAARYDGSDHVEEQRRRMGQGVEELRTQLSRESVPGPKTMMMISSHRLFWITLLQMIEFIVCRKITNLFSSLRWIELFIASTQH